MVIKITKEVEKKDNGTRGCDKKKKKAMLITSRKTKTKRWDKDAKSYLI